MSYLIAFLSGLGIGVLLSVTRNVIHYGTLMDRYRRNPGFVGRPIIKFDMLTFFALYHGVWAGVLSVAIYTLVTFLAHLI